MSFDNDRNGNDFMKGHSSDIKLAGDLSEDAFSKMQADIKKSSIIVTVAYVVGLVIILWAFFDDDVPAIVYYIIVVAIIFGQTFVDKKFYKTKSQQFKNTFVRKCFAKKTDLKVFPSSIDMLPELERSILQLSGINAAAKAVYSINDYATFKYRNRVIRFIDAACNVGNQTAFDGHVFIIQLPKKIENGPIYITTRKTVLGINCSGYAEDASLESLPINHDQSIKRKFLIGKPKEGFFHDKVDTSFHEAISKVAKWEADNSKNYESLDEQTDSIPTYRASEMFTADLGKILMRLANTYKDVIFSVQEDYLTFAVPNKTDLFEAHFKYGFKSADFIEEAVCAEVDVVLAKIEPILNHIASVWGE